MDSHVCLREDTVRQWGFIDLGLYNGESHPGNETEKEFQVGNPWRLFTFGLFALWSSYNAVLFDGIVAASPSVWYKDWLSYSEQNRCSCRNVYLSLGDKESHSKNKLMATVAECIELQKKILDSQNVNVVMEWNEGNHFTDNGERTAKGFAWCLKSCREESGC